MSIRRFAAAALAAVFLLAASAVAAPNLSGSWKLNAAKSDFGPMPAPDKWDMTVEHKDPDLKVTTVMVNQMGERTTEATYKTDGTETEADRGQWRSKSTAKWDGNTLHIVSKASTQMGDLTITEQWNLSEDGKTLTVASKWSSERGEFESKRVLDKQ
jgi:hypothetical protein